MEHEDDGDTNCSWGTWNSSKDFEKKNLKNWKSEKESRFKSLTDGRPTLSTSGTYALRVLIGP